MPSHAATKFAAPLHVNVGTLRNWEQGLREIRKKNEPRRRDNYHPQLEKDA